MDTTQGRLMAAVANLIKAKGRFHTEQNYAALVAAYDAAIAAPVPTVQDGYALRALKHIIPFRIELIVGSFGKCASTDVILQACSSAVAEIEAAQSAPGAGAVPVYQIRRRHEIGGTEHSWSDCTADRHIDVADHNEVRTLYTYPIAAQEPVAIHQWRRRKALSESPWHDADKEATYSRVDEFYEARTLYTAPTAPQAGSEMPALPEEEYIGGEANLGYTAKHMEGYARAALAAARQAPQRQWDENGRTNDGDETGGTVQRFGFDCTRLPVDIIPATNGSFVHYSDYSKLFEQVAAPQAVAAPDRDAALEALQKAADTVQQFKRDWQRVPYFADRVNKATREAIGMAVGAIVNLDAVGCPLDMSKYTITQPSAAPAEASFCDGSEALAATEKYLAEAQAAATEHLNSDWGDAAPADPCPQCIPGAVCKTPTCGRLLAAAKSGA